jgi:cytochrome oxidase Cu insertion factor (SCO1/SenC/PrrC family)
MIRTPVALIPYIVLVTVLLSAVLWQKGDEMIGSQVTIGGKALVGGPFGLIDQNGEGRSDKDFRGRYMLIYFGYTFCPDVCPLSLGVMEDALANLPREKRGSIVPIFITVDPERDTPKAMKTYLQGFGKEWVGLTGDPVSIKHAATEYRVFYAKQPLKGGGYAMAHSSTIYLMAPDGSFITHYDESIGPKALADDLKKRI